MSLLTLVGAVFALFVAIARGRRKARRRQPAPGRFTVLPRTRPRDVDITAELHDPARPL